MGKYFGTDGIRGRVPIEVNNSVAFKVGQSLKSCLGTTRLVVGMDTRESSSELLYSVISGARSVGIDVMNAGVVSTPLIALYSHQKQISGVMITASHNPYTDNGIKVFDKGSKLSIEQESAIEDYIDNNDSFHVTKLGELYSGEEVLDLYLDVIEALDLYQTDLKIGIDSANGANYLIVKGIYQELAPNMVQVANQPDGKNINHGVGSTHLEHIQQVVKEQQLDIGFSFDGDGDRVLVVDQDGEVFDGDKIIYIIACYLKEIGMLHKDTVVLTKMSNLGIIKALNQKGIEVKLVNVGDKYVLQEINQNGYSIGGENSGHIILKEFLNTGDGLLVSLIVLKILQDTDQSLKELTKDIKMWPQKLVNIRTFNKTILEDKRVQNVIKKVTNTLQDNGKVLVRASGTEPLIRVTLSCETQAELDKYMNQIVEMIQTVKEEV
jgi:phosphoglucosamine mutase